MRFAHVGDTHLTDSPGESTMTLAEQVELLRWIGIDALDAGARAILHGGDVFDAASTPAERNAAIEVMRGWADRLPVFVVKGNHDRHLDLLYLAALRTKHPIRVFERPAVDVAGNTLIAMLPWPRKAQLVAALGVTSGLDIATAAGDAMRAILAGFRMQLAAHDGPRILLGHVELGGAKLDNGQPVAGRCDIAIAEGDLLDVGADVACLSHIHLHQVLADGRLVYAGAPRPTRFGEDAPKGYCLIDVERGKPAKIEHRRTPYRPMVTIGAAWGAKLERLTTEEDPSDTEWWTPPRGTALRLHYSVSEENRRAAATQAAEIKNLWLDAGAHSVALDPKVTTVHRTRSIEITTARTTSDRVRAYWKVRGAEPARAPQLLAKLEGLEQTLENQ